MNESVPKALEEVHWEACGLGCPVLECSVTDLE